MSKSSTASAQKIPTQLSTKSAWAKGPPNTSSAAGSPRSQSPAPNNATPPSSVNHSRRPSALGQGIPIKDGVSVPRNNVGAVKPSSSVTFGSIDDASAPISSSPAAAPPVKSEGVKAFGSVSTSGHVNGKPSISSSSKTASNPPPNGTAIPATSTPPPPSKPLKMDIHKLFQGTSSSGPSQTPPSDVSSPSTRPSSLPAQQQHHSSQQPQQGQQQQQPSQPSQLGAHSYTPFVPSRGMVPHQPNSGRVPPGSPVYPRQQLTNGNSGRPPGGPNGPGGPQIPAGLSSPRLGPHNHLGQQQQQQQQQQPGMPPPQPMPLSIPTWPGYYPQEPYYYPWYISGPVMAHQQQHAHHPLQQHPHPPSGPPGQPHTGMPMSPRTQHLPLQGPSTPTQSHAIPNSLHGPSHQPNAPHSHTHTNSVSGLTSPPSTPATSTHGNLPGSGISGAARLNTNASAFVPNRSAAKVIIKSEDGKEVDLQMLKKGSPGPPPGSPGLGGFNATSNGSPASNRKSIIRMESEDARKKRVAEEEAEKEKERAKKEAAAKAKKVAEEKAKREEEERVAAAKKKEEEQKELERKQEEERLRKEEEEKERLRKEAEEKERLQKEEEERVKREETERMRIAEEEAKKAAEEAERIKQEAEAKAAAEAASNGQEDGQVAEEQDEETYAEIKQQGKDKSKDKENLRIDTSNSIAADLPRKRPGPLDLSYASKSILPSLPSALATARIIDDIGQITYPEGIKSPKIELNINAKDGKFKYDRDFLLQFMLICKEKPDRIPDAIGLEPTDQSHHHMSRGGSGRRSTSAMTTANPRQASIGLGLGSFGKTTAPNPFSMGNFSTPSTGGKLTSDDRFAISSGRAVSVGGPTGLPFGRPTPLVRTPSQGGPAVHPMGSNRTRSKRGEKRNDSNKVSTHQQGHGSGFNQGFQGQMGPGGVTLEPVAPLELSTNRWVASSTSRKPQPIDSDSPDNVDRKVKGLLNKLTMEKFDSISDQIIAWANKSEKEKDGRTLIQVIRLVFEKATDEAAWSEMYARLCRKMMEQISSKVQDDGIKNTEGKPIAGGQLFRKYLLNRCQEDFERGWAAKDAAAAAAIAKASEDEAVKEANDRNKDSDDEPVMYSDEYYIAQKAKRQGLGLIKFIGELFKLQMLTERIMHECVKKLLGNVENPEEEEIESLCKLLTTVGQILDTNKARAHMDVYFSRMKELTKSLNVSSRMQYMLQDVIELRERKWVARNQVAAPSTIAQIHEGAAKDRAAAEKETYQRQMSMSRGGSKRGGERGQFDQQTGPDGWAVAGGSTGLPRPPPKAGDLSNFGKINKSAPMTFGPSSVFAGKKESKTIRQEPLSRTASSSNMFSMLSQNPEIAAEAAASKSSRPPSRKASDDLSQPGIHEPQRKKLNLLPRSKPTEEEVTPVSAGVSEDGEVDELTMSEANATKRIEEDSKEFFGVRNLEEAEVYFTNLPDEHRFRLVDKLVRSAIELKEADAELVGDFFRHAASKDLCSSASFEEGFLPTAEAFDDIAIDVPKAFDLMAIMIKGASLDEERQRRIAAKSMSGDKLVALLS